MSATERLRELLDERGVEHEGGERSLRWRDRYGVMMQAFPLADGELGMEVWSCTPEQAIAATLGDVPRLPYWWTHDGTLHVELPKLPNSISVLLPDVRDREVRSARTWQYTRDSGTCHAIVSDNLTESEGMGDAWADCSECGHLLFVLTDPTSEPPNYCPNCEAKVVEPTTNDVDVEVDA